MYAPCGSRLPRTCLAGRRLLEIGCGYCGALVAFEEAGAAATGIEIDEHRTEYAQARGLNAITADAATLPFADESFDVIGSDSVIEHISDLRAALRERGWIHGTPSALSR